MLMDSAHKDADKMSCHQHKAETRALVQYRSDSTMTNQNTSINILNQARQIIAEDHPLQVFKNHKWLQKSLSSGMSICFGENFKSFAWALEVSRQH